MNEEMMTNEVTEVEAKEIEVIDMPEESGNDSLVGKILIGVGAVVIGGVTALVVKNWRKIKARDEEKNVKKLRKKGYTVTKTVYLDNDADKCVDEDVQEEATAE